MGNTLVNLLIPVGGLCAALALLLPRPSRALAVASAILFGAAVIYVLAHSV